MNLVYCGGNVRYFEGLVHYSTYDLEQARPSVRFPIYFCWFRWTCSNARHGSRPWTLEGPSRAPVPAFLSGLNGAPFVQTSQDTISWKLSPRVENHRCTDTRDTSFRCTWRVARFNALQCMMGCLTRHMPNGPHCGTPCVNAILLSPFRTYPVSYKKANHCSKIEVSPLLPVASRVGSASLS